MDETVLKLSKNILILSSSNSNTYLKKIFTHKSYGFKMPIFEMLDKFELTKNYDLIIFNCEMNDKDAELEKQVQDLHETAVLKGWSVNFSVDKDLDRTVVKVVDSKTKETIRQIPSEEWLYTAKRLKEFSELNDKQPQQLEPGLLFDKKV